MADWDVVASTPLPPAPKRDPFALRVEHQESRGNPLAVNAKSGAIGSMQTLPSTLKDPGYGVRPAQNDSPEEMTRVGDDYLAALRKKYGDDRLALAAYNWGPGNVNDLLKKGVTADSPDFHSSLPAETQDYITKIMGPPAPAAPVDKDAWTVTAVTPATAAPETPAAPTAPVQDEWTAVKTIPVTDWRDPLKGNKTAEWLASIFDPAQKAGAHLVSNVAAPVLSEQSKAALQKEGLYDPNQSPVQEYSQAAYSTMMAPIAPLFEAVAEKAKEAGEATIGKEATANTGSVLTTAMDVLGVAGPGFKNSVAGKKFSKPVGELPVAERTPGNIETRMAELEKQHDAVKDPTVKAQIKQRMDELVAQHPETVEAIRSKAIPETPAEAPPTARAVSSGWNVINPEGAGPKAVDTATTIRAEMGTADRTAAMADATMAKSYDLASTLNPVQRADFYNYVEGRSKGAELKDPSLQKMADDTRSVMENVRKEIETLPKAEQMGFYEDYFPHMWKDPEAARTFVNSFAPRQGSSAALKKRTIPTIAEGEAAGLQLADPNPVTTASRYAASMSNYIASKRIIEQMKDKGDAKYFRPGAQPEGWQPLTGRYGERTRAFTKDIPESVTGGLPDVGAVAMHEKLYAPPEVARIYNNFYSKGVEVTDFKKPYEVARQLTVANTAAELSLSAFHAILITAQLLANDVTRVLKNSFVGDWKGVMKGAQSTVAGQIPFVKGSAYNIGRDLIKQYKGLKDYGVNMKEIAEHFERGGGKVSMHSLHRANEKGGLFTGKGGIKKTMADITEEISKPGLTPKGRAAIEVFQRAVEDVSYPLFHKYIPAVKTGAFANLMGDWMRQNPKASAAEVSAARRRIVDLVDDRFGEMNMNNMFWHKYLKQLAAVGLRAQGWDIGLVRQAGGGALDAGRVIRDLVKERKINPNMLDRPLFLFSVMGVMAFTSAAYQYLKTGKPPEEALDYFAPKTGGKSIRGTPERVVLPAAAHGKEIMHIAEPFVNEGMTGTESPLEGLTKLASNKLATLPRNVVQAYMNEDYFGNKIAPTTGPGGWIGSVPERIGHVAGGFTPFGMSSQSDKLRGSALSDFERRFLGIAPAGKATADHDLNHWSKWTKALREEKKAMKSEAYFEGMKDKNDKSKKDWTPVR